MLKRRTKIVNFRVTEDEFESLKAACSHRGARCLSDFARATVLNRTGGDESAVAAAVDSVITRMNSLEDKVAAIELAADRILGLLPVDRKPAFAASAAAGQGDPECA